MGNLRCENIKEKTSIRKSFYLISIISFLINIVAYSQTIDVSGIIKDSATLEPISFANIVFTGTNIGTCSNLDGSFNLKNTAEATSLTVSLLGYQQTVINLTENYTTNLEIKLPIESVQLDEFVITDKKKVSYSKKDNPAIDFMREVIERRKDNNIESKPYYQVERYEKFTTSLSNFDSIGKVFQRFNFLKSNIDTSAIDGKPILTLAIKETATDIYYRKMPNTKKEIDKAQRSEGIGKDLDESINYNIQELFRGINLYDNNIKLLQYYFISPLSSSMALSFYKYYIVDTLTIDGIECMEMAFFPYNHQSMGFIGTLYITLDGNYSLKKADLVVPEKINLNFAKNLHISQTFEQLNDNISVLIEENLYVNMYLFRNIPEVQINQFRTYKNYNFESFDNTIFNISQQNSFTSDNKLIMSDEFWTNIRPVPLKQKELGVKKLFTQIQEIPLYKTVVRISDFISSGYFLTGGSRDKSMFDIGPLPSIFSINDIEGCRFKLGIMTTANLNSNVFVSGYAAYGIRDNKFKYGGTLSYSFDKKNYHPLEFPRNNLTLTYNYDLFTLGSVFSDFQKDDFLISWKVGDPITKASYIRTISIGYEKDFSRDFNFRVTLKNQVDTPTGSLIYRLNSEDPISNINLLRTTELGLHLKYTIGATPYNGLNSAMNLSKDVVEFTLSHYIGIQGLFGGQYHYEHTEIAFKKSINLAAFGYLNAHIKAGMVWTPVPFPLLIFPNATQSVIMQSDAFNTMNALEFVMDKHLSVNLTYHLNGLIFNRIPYFNFLKLREVVSFNGVWGALSDKNNPDISSGLFILPEGTSAIGKVPFMEMSFGIENIFKVFRIDYVHRLTYNNGTKHRGGVRFTFGINF
ncbi:MAG: DUF5686 and carboxypeptidase regulatory-like domain-containing protein [Bacteroidales bacterium]|jgi:hypothetical protein|nr:DUF5686 and carboxypeptidase regulatory-like domain-containing protein [Bacteroidales bacterium]